MGQRFRLKSEVRNGSVLRTHYLLGEKDVILTGTLFPGESQTSLKDNNGR